MPYPTFLRVLSLIMMALMGCSPELAAPCSTAADCPAKAPICAEVYCFEPFDADRPDAAEQDRTVIDPDRAVIDTDMAEMAWMTNDPDTLPYLALRSKAWPSEGGFNSGYYANEKVDELLEAARTATDIEERARLYREMQTIVQEDAPWVFVANWKQNAVTSDRVENFGLEPSFLLHLQGVVKK